MTFDFHGDMTSADLVEVRDAFAENLTRRLRQEPLFADDLRHAIHEALWRVVSDELNAIDSSWRSTPRDVPDPLGSLRRIEHAADVLVTLLMVVEDALIHGRLSRVPPDAATAKLVLEIFDRANEAPPVRSSNTAPKTIAMRDVAVAMCKLALLGEDPTTEESAS